jgi:hypothetical protein
MDGVQTTEALVARSIVAQHEAHKRFMAAERRWKANSSGHSWNEVCRCLDAYTQAKALHRAAIVELLCRADAHAYR